MGSDGYGIGGAFLWITINGTSWEYVSHVRLFYFNFLFVPSQWRGSF